MSNRIVGGYPKVDSCPFRGEVATNPHTTFTVACKGSFYKYTI